MRRTSSAAGTGDAAADGVAGVDAGANPLIRRRMRRAKVSTMGTKAKSK
jgi:hypothetical protein